MCSGSPTTYAGAGCTAPPTVAMPAGARGRVPPRYAAGALCKSVAKATEVRILDPPHAVRTASDLRSRGQRPFPYGPIASRRRRPTPAAGGHMVGGTDLG